MKKIIFTCLVFLAVNCKEKSDPVTSGINEAGVDLLANPTFEVNGQPSLADWIVPDTSAVHFSNDIPSGGQGNSIILHTYAGNFPGTSIYKYITGAKGTHRYQMSCWAKRSGTGGYFSVYIKQGNTISLCPQLHIAIAETSWTSFSLEDTLTTSTHDTLLAFVSGGFVFLYPGTTYFNSCMLKRY